jgi:adenylyltransferase/sulfurtransferase
LKRFTSESTALILSSSLDIVLDCSDNATTRLVLSKTCQAAQVPLVFGSAISYDGQVAVVHPDGPGIEDILPGLSQSTDTCDGLGVFGPVPVLIGCMQAIEAIKVMTNLHSSNHSNQCESTLSCYSSLENSMFQLKVHKPFQQLQKIVEELNIEKTWDDYLAYPSPKVLIDMRKNFDEDEELVGAIRSNDNIENINVIFDRIIPNSTIFIICELGERSKLLVQKLSQTKTLTIFSIKGGTKQVFL